ncbi:MAG: TraR/DksA C4-type zinc finger protein [Planctomycetes bacterium]|nr:TraR/DksA C4-type zinc finger protein [Planctomycetota bacterium]
MAGKANKGAKQEKLTTADLKDLRKRLLDRKAELVDEINTILGQAHTSSDNRSAEVMDQASDSYDDELAMQLARNQMEQLLAIDEALKQMDEGIYGVCEGCGQFIGVKRLEAIPFAALCMDCKRRQEEEGGEEDEFERAGPSFTTIE